MKQYSKRTLISSIITAVVATAVMLSGAAWLFLGESGRTLVAANWYVQNRFVGKYEEQDWLDGTLTALVGELGDRWSYYADAEYYVYQQDSRDGSYVGIGITVSYGNPRGLTIETVTPGGPAEQVGVVAGSLIVGADGTAYVYENRYEFVNAIGGEAGTTVSLDIEDGDGAVQTVSITRNRIEAQPVRSRIEENIGIITYTNFYLHSGEKFIAAVDDLQAQGVEGLIIDLRGNPGGYLTDLIQVLDYLLPEGEIFRSVSYSGKETVTQSDTSSVDLPMVVLVDGGSYSAAEFCAAQLRESIGAPLVGEATSGKGYSQQALPLPNGGAMNISTAEYQTGGGVSLAGVGLTPDYVLENEGENDSQMAKALEIIQTLVIKKY